VGGRASEGAVKAYARSGPEALGAAAAMKRPSALTSLAAFLALVAVVGFVSSQLGVSVQTQALTLLVSCWLFLGALGAQAQWERGGSVGLGFVVVLLFGPLGLLAANYSGGRECPACRSRGMHRDATRCAKCGAAL
jgi:hypothetical protein